MVETISLTKNSYRAHLEQKRAFVSLARRQEASSTAAKVLRPFIQANSWILSYASFRSELNTVLLNTLILNCSQLVLPKIEGRELGLFHVTSFDQLKINSWGILEPDSVLCTEVQMTQVNLAFIPGLGFETNRAHRLGYGKGYYDRLLSQLSSRALTFGIGFKEQQVPYLPILSHDIPLKHIYLF